MICKAKGRIKKEPTARQPMGSGVFRHTPNKEECSKQKRQANHSMKFCTDYSQQGDLPEDSHISRSQKIVNAAGKRAHAAVLESTRKQQLQELMTAAGDAQFARVPTWASALRPEISPTPLIVFGLIFSFQAAGGEYRMSLKIVASMLGVSEGTLSTNLKNLCDNGYVERRDHGQGKTPSYLVNVLFCVEQALQNGWNGKGADEIKKALAKGQREKAEKLAFKAPFARVPTWAFALKREGVSRVQQIILGRVFSFQFTGGDAAGDGEFRMSMANGGEALGMKRNNLNRELNKLCKLGFLEKRANEAGRPFSYTVNIPLCIEKARQNGWKG